MSCLVVQCMWGPPSENKCLCVNRDSLLTTQCVSERKVCLMSDLLAPSFVKVSLVSILFVLPQVSLGVVVGLLRFIVRLELQKVMRHEVGLLTEQFGLAFCATFAALRRTKMDADCWWNICGKGASLAVDSVTVKLLLDAGAGSWAAFAPQIANMCALPNIVSKKEPRQEALRLGPAFRRLGEGRGHDQGCHQEGQGEHHEGHEHLKGRLGLGALD